MHEYVDKRVQRSKTALKETLLKLLKDKDFLQITISEIVKAANYNRGTFYSHYASKEELLDEIIEDTLEEMTRHIRKPYKNHDKVNMREMQAENITLFHYFKNNQELFYTLLSENIHLDFRYKLAKQIEKLFLAEYQYEFSEETKLEQKWLYVYRANGVAAVILRWIEDGFQESPVFMAEQIIALMITGTDIFYVKD
ncbi:TetR/AcrR family transcriptional regulator [Psychrobacillus lasiicapitis]|uniref:TetR family transcriptional regulator n=1 Tax=Psychrobacillus lasiicapitis TaxID=1636719 RepID=A0A544SYP8_9BACI|nr:TetR/AcrR family transcriptional regulator [Psychrobacillus lasiicapitis]TQR10277.1 TetR family transcriptional regulator [Psychrobacillus lasiicapitis]GGA46889.1 TetR family transcriptional regulator [Psychrobacillus lasiicapitis]